MRLKQSYTIDQELGIWLADKAKKEETSASEILNRILSESYSSDKDVYFRLSLIDRSLRKLEKEKKDLFDYLEKQIEDGNKAERDAAEKKKKEEDEAFQSRLQRYRAIYEVIKDRPEFRAFIDTGETDVKAYCKFAVVLQSEGHKIGGLDIKNVISLMSYLKK